MISYGLALILIGILRALTAPLLMLPDATLPAIIDTTFNSAAGYLGFINGFVPITSFVAVFAFILTFEAGYLVFRIIKFILSRT